MLRKGEESSGELVLPSPIEKHGVGSFGLFQGAAETPALVSSIGNGDSDSGPMWHAKRPGPQSAGRVAASSTASTSAETRPNDDPPVCTLAISKEITMVTIPEAICSGLISLRVVPAA